ncbi:2-oxo acid dehydrogenase subunit E2 [Humibacillus xanthopallidus]|uniref:2-oxoacid dehydrogenase/acyltransferase catalytic subunit n=1 Tax=Humibacillus xanthopallidus TaxID=412689 RepID=A0A543HHS7_9MICO|nr:2-oxo acid dehydrogenase subunit E2 [Humibacillus xanthopallidus]TQM57878.1 2-oxoacid dehydrogenase/acyltransferase catalytic subunit [Humibacillus xanthopallidus]
MNGAAGASYVLRPIPKERQPVLDRLTSASRRFQVHALVELDVTDAGERIREARPAVSWTGFVIATVARAVVEHPEVNARKAGNTLLLFDHVDVGATVERVENGRAVLDIAIIRAADRKSSAEITDELHRAKYGPARAHPQSRLTAALVRLPGPLRRTAIRMASTRPGIAATFGPAVGVTSIGMFTHGWGWAIPVAPLTLIVTVGSVVERPAVHHGQIVPRLMLPLTLSFDHAVIDGAPAARFTETLRALTETGAALDPPPR